MTITHRKPQVCVLGSAEPGSAAYDLASQAGTLLATLGITVATRNTSIACSAMPSARPRFFTNHRLIARLQVTGVEPMPTSPTRNHKM